MNGFIYIMSNRSFSDGLLKIGKSKHDPGSFRKDELYTPGVPEPFKVEYVAFCEDFDSVELETHRELETYRPNKNREFFNCSVPQAIIAIRNNANIKFEEISYKSPQEIEQEEVRQKRQEEHELGKIRQKEQQEKHLQRRREIRTKKRKEFVESEFNKKYSWRNNGSYFVISFIAGVIISGIFDWGDLIGFFSMAVIFFFLKYNESQIKEKLGNTAFEKFPDV